MNSVTSIFGGVGSHLTAATSWNPVLIWRIMTAPVVKLERGYCNDSAERWANSTMSQPESQQRCIIQDIHLSTWTYNTKLFPSFSVNFPTSPRPHRLPTTSSYSRHSAVSSCPPHFLAPPTPLFPLNPWPRRQRDRVVTAWLQLFVLVIFIQLRLFMAWSRMVPQLRSVMMSINKDKNCHRTERKNQSPPFWIWDLYTYSKPRVSSNVKIRKIHTPRFFADCTCLTYNRLHENQFMTLHCCNRVNVCAQYLCWQYFN